MYPWWYWVILYVEVAILTAAAMTGIFLLGRKELDSDNSNLIVATSLLWFLLLPAMLVVGICLGLCDAYSSLYTLGLNTLKNADKLREEV